MKKTKVKTKKQKIVREKKDSQQTYKNLFMISVVVIVFLTGFLTYVIFAQYNPFTLLP